MSYFLTTIVPALASEQSAWLFLITLGMVWNRECPHCNQLLQYVYVEDMYRCTPCEYDEHVRFALTELTTFSGNCTQIVTILYGLAKSKNCLRQVAEEAGVSLPLVSRIKKEITGRIKEWLWKSCSNVIGGIGRVVEIDEAQLGRRKNHRGKERRCEWVLGMIERGSNRISLASVIRRTTKEMYPLILERVLPGTVVVTDEWAAYNELTRDPDYHHLTVNHSISFKSPEGQTTNTIEGSWFHLRRSVSTSMCVEDQYAWFMFRRAFMCSGSVEKEFSNLISCIANPDYCPS